MSWFDASGIANLAKSALKEAQKTIDKALDITEEEQKQTDRPSGDGVGKGDKDDFFAEWGINNNDSRADRDETVVSAIGKEKSVTTSAIWGSFAGSFFENQDVRTDIQGTVANVERSSSLVKNVDTNVRTTSPQRTFGDRGTDKWYNNLGYRHGSSDSSSTMHAEVAHGSIENPLSSHMGSNKHFTNFEPLRLCESSDAINDESFSNSQLIVELDDEGVRGSDEEGNCIGMLTTTTEPIAQTRIDDDSVRRRRSCDGADLDASQMIPLTRRRELNSTNRVTNRMSLVSCESDKKSSDSVEILGSRSSEGTDCTTTPDSELNSAGNSIASSAVSTKVHSESVEILPDSTSLTTSPSSVEILGEWRTESSLFPSPVDLAPEDAAETGAKKSATSHTSYVEQVWEQDCCDSVDDIESMEQRPSSVSRKHIAVRSSLALTAPTISLQINRTSDTDNVDVSPESVEVIPEIDETEEPSLADDSYASASEGTVLVTVMESTYRPQFPESGRTKLTEVADRSSIMYNSSPDTRQNAARMKLTDTQLSLDSLKEKQSFRCTPNRAPITTQPIRKPTDALQFEVIDPLKSSTIELTERDIFQDSIAQLQNNKSPDCCYQERQEQQQVPHVATDHSSCVDGPVATTFKNNTRSISQVELKDVDTNILTASSYVKNMLAEAMAEKIEAINSMQRCKQADAVRDTSPISSESRSDLVKIGSDQTSGHTSGDELETATSSDIEIISRYSPNGDSSSTQSRQSPAKLQGHKSSDLLTKTLNKTRGHSRELSEISIGSDDTNIEIEKLLKRIQEMNEILEARESKLVDISRINMELHERNESLRSQLDNIEMQEEESQELSQITDEYTQRLSALERKFQQAIRERDTLRKQMEQFKHEASGRPSTQELSAIITEKDQIIKELREEGEKLSKQQLQHSNIIKKLRLKEKESDNIIKQQNELIEEQTLELDRLKRLVHAKEDVERNQIEAVHTLTAKTKRQEKEVSSLQEKLDDVLHKLDTHKTSLDAAKTDLAETKQHLVFAEEELKEAVENAGELSQLLGQVRDLKIRLRQVEETGAKKEESLRQGNSELLKRLEASEARNEELAESVSISTKPLLRQLEQLQSSLSHKTASFLKQEKTMSEMIVDLQRKLDITIEMNRSLTEEKRTVKTELTSLETRANAIKMEKDALSKLYEEMRRGNALLTEEKDMLIHRMEMIEQSHVNKAKEYEREIVSLESKLSVERAATDAEKRRIHASLDQQQLRCPEDEPRLSPTSSIGRESVGSLSSVWPSFNDTTLETGSGRFGNAYDSVSNSTTMFENLQSQLKQRDGEVQQLQWELSRRNAERETLHSELSKLTLKVENLNSRIFEVEALNENLNDTRTKYDALLQMYGEKVEENQELRLDLEDVKEMYKSQIDQLLARDAPNSHRN